MIQGGDIQRKSRELRQRSMSSKNIRNSKDVRCSETNMKNYDYARNSKELSKFDYDLSSQKNRSKNLNENTDYIKNLYKKYLGKENQNQSDKKIKSDFKTQKTFVRQEGRQTTKVSARGKANVPLIIKNVCTQQQSYQKYHQKQSQDLGFLSNKYSIIKNKSLNSFKIQNQKRKLNFEDSKSKDLLNVMTKDMLEMLGDDRNCMVRALKNLHRLKQKQAQNKLD